MSDHVTEIALIDLSGIAYPIFLTSGSQPDPDYTSREIVSRVRSLAVNHPKAAVCCDSGKSFRHEIDPTYKAQRDAQPAALYHQIDLAKEILEADGFPVWSVNGFEADDLIASATAIALTLEDVNVLILSADKDLLQLVGPRVRCISVNSGAVYDEAAVVAKFGVLPIQMRDYLSLVGDASDNVKGAKGIGPKKAADLLQVYGSLGNLYIRLSEHGTAFKPAIATALREFEGRRRIVEALIELRTDVDLPFAELDNDRAPKMEAEGMGMTWTVNPEDIAVVAVGEEKTIAPPVVKSGPALVNGDNGKSDYVNAVPPADALAPAPMEFERQLEPRSLGQAWKVAEAMFRARMFNGYGTAESVLSTVLAGRELGLQAIASLRAFHVIDGKHALAADAMRGLVLRGGAAKYFRCVERSPEKASFETWRAGDPAPIALSYTLTEARAAYGFNGQNEKALSELETKWARSSWAKHTADMLAARASSKLARLVYADILFGLYSPAELSDNHTD